MGCNKRMEVSTPTDDRCNEMIAEFEARIKAVKGDSFGFSDEEKKVISETIKANPNHSWHVNAQGGLMHGVLWG